MKKAFRFLAGGAAYIVPFICFLAIGESIGYAIYMSFFALVVFTAIAYSGSSGILKLKEGKKLTAIVYLCSAGLMIAIVLAFVFMTTVMEMKYESHALEHQQAIERIIKSDDFKKKLVERQEELRKRYLQERGVK